MTDRGHVEADLVRPSGLKRNLDNRKAGTGGDEAILAYRFRAGIDIARLIEWPIALPIGRLITPAGAGMPRTTAKYLLASARDASK